MSRRDAEGLRILARAAEVREMDRRTIQEFGIPGEVLMELAGAGTARIIHRHIGRAAKAVILCGGGNNGGDGYVIARHLDDRGWSVSCISTREAPSLQGDAALNHGRWTACGGETRSAVKGVTAKMRNRIGHADVVVDALFGTGLSRPVEGPAADLIAAANEKVHPLRVAVDVPSGLDADTGQGSGPVFQADLTATYGFEKPGLHQSPGRDRAGRVYEIRIGLPRHIVAAVGPSVRWLDEEAAAALIPAREPAGHKGRYGHVTVVGGFAGKEGAGALAAMGALHGGAGLVTWQSDGAHEVVTRPPEIMVLHINEGLEPRATVCVVGPGLGVDATAIAALDLVTRSGLPYVLDADGCNLLAARSEPLEAGAARILTPHPAEAARLLGCETAEVQRDRLAAAATLAERYGATVVLKGATTVVSEEGQPSVLIHEGDPTLSAGGTGDVLAGLIASLIGQGLAPRVAAMLGVFLHGRAGVLAGADRAARGVTASEVSAAVPRVIEELALGWGRPG